MIQAFNQRQGINTYSRLLDEIQMYKLFNGLDKVQWQAPLQWRPPRSGHRSMLAREIVKGCDARHNFFTNRIANTWNQLYQTALFLLQLLTLLSLNLANSDKAARARHLLLVCLRTIYCNLQFNFLWSSYFYYYYYYYYCPNSERLDVQSNCASSCKRNYY